MNHDKDSDALWNAIHQIEISVKNSQNDIKKLFLHSVRHEIAIETLNKKVDAHQQENRERFNRIENRLDNIDNRFDKVEETLAIIVNHLKP
ncbi:hypothetical protein [Endozoicomonas sp. GU-1]|uniref:hypothetical protein n=1 Tax=Endozoicomonas sp. GU-1 TaxID=3009078 RepID=UPI0022B2D669|nr:hypothetical protein [Endozoicomonas sp. GU-1]WBA81366.1 hypothetical protein O2T12_24320 [Endozoicomonas sp. GU-1]WBA84314.1 hypothetical protein O3276_13490 [Endozoicomonas sp. GU-1]